MARTVRGFGSFHSHKSARAEGGRAAVTPLRCLLAALFVFSGFTVLAGTPPAPTLLGPPNGATNLDPRNFTFYWSISNGYYEPYLVYHVAGTPWEPHTPGYTSGSSYTTQLQPHTTYEWQVAGVDWWRSNPNTSDWYTWSEWRQFTTGSSGGQTGVCTPNSTRSQSCTTGEGCSGTQTQTCNASGTAWGGWSGCNDTPGDGCPTQQGGSAPLAADFRFPLQCYNLNSSNGFGDFNADRDRCANGDIKRHLGEDIRAPQGTPVYAAGDGIVRFAGPSGNCETGWGSLVIIESTLSNGQTACLIYGHVSAAVSPHQTVTKGSIVGYVAHFSCWGDHLHFAVYKGPYSDITCSQNSCSTRGYYCPSEFPGQYRSPNDFIACPAQ